MMMHPSILALVAGNLLTVGFAIYACGWGARILLHWDLTSGSALQLQLERRTVLISTIMASLLALEVFGLFLFLNTVDRLHPLFIGAMCAAGSLNVNGFGYPTLVMKIFTVLGCGVWLLLNRVDNQAEDYPLIRQKYRFLFLLTGIMIVGAVFQLAYFKGLKAQVITSCCGSLFSTDAGNLAGGVASLPVDWARAIFFGMAALHIRTAIHFLFTSKGGGAMGWISGLYFITALAAVISFISVYYYELPTHHCPFDILQAGYHYVGYGLYATLFASAITGMGVGVLSRYGAVPSLAAVLPVSMHRCAWVSLISGIAFLAIAVYPMIFSDFIL